VFRFVKINYNGFFISSTTTRNLSIGAQVLQTLINIKKSTLIDTSGPDGQCPDHGLHVCHMNKGWGGIKYQLVYLIEPPITCLHS
jgi:hypothetical protein